MGDDATCVGVLSRAMAVLDCFNEDNVVLSAAELGASTGLPPSTLHRLLSQLTEFGMLMRAPGHRYAIGTRLWELGQLSPISIRLRERALPHMVRLYEATGENVHLGVLEGPNPERAHVLFVGRITGHSAVPTLGRLGGRYSLHTTGVGKALLATRDEQWLARYFTTPLIPETLHSVTTETQLRAHLEHTRVRGFALTREEMTLGNVSVAAALGRVEGLPPSAIGIVVHLDRADERSLGLLITQVAKDLTRDLRAA